MHLTIEITPDFRMSANVTPTSPGIISLGVHVQDVCRTVTATDHLQCAPISLRFSMMAKYDEEWVDIVQAALCDSIHK